MDFGGFRTYVSGDTEDIPEMRALTDIDLAFVPMNLPYTMDVEKAADAVAEFKPTYCYPYHYRDSDPVKFAELVAASGASDASQVQYLVFRRSRSCWPICTRRR